MTTFGTRLKELRREKGLTQEALARAAGLSKGGVSDLEQDRRASPSWDTVQKLAAALGAATDAFITKKRKS
jgi:transcriptional regulator with XRE-family HTH domain